MNGIVVDVDDTLVDTRQRIRRVFTLLLGRDIPLEAVETQGLEQIFVKYASPEQKRRGKEHQTRFWNLLLCLEEAGLESLRLHKPIPHAAQVLQTWSHEAKIIYLTGRTENTRSHTLAELEQFGFPVDGAELVMFKPGDYARPKGDDPSGPTLVDTKGKLLTAVCQKTRVVRVVDDYPGYFPIFERLNIPDRIGFLRPPRYRPSHYLERGATRVIESWKELQEDTLTNET